MKTRTFSAGVISLLMIIGFLLSGCTSTPAGVSVNSTRFQDLSIPWQEHAMVFLSMPSGISHGIRINSVDSENSNKTSIVSSGNVVIIPPGTHMIHTQVWRLVSNSEVSIAIPVTYEFQPGEHYILTGEVQRRLLTVSGSAKVITLNEYRTIYTEAWKNAAIKYTDEEIENKFKKDVVDRFDNLADVLRNQ